jgi:hypothetical protein
MNKKQYMKPESFTVILHHRQSLLDGTAQTPSGPSATFMNNPSISETDTDSDEE